jgi:peptide/nickel transport system permease protein
MTVSGDPVQALGGAGTVPRPARKRRRVDVGGVVVAGGSLLLVLAVVGAGLLTRYDPTEIVGTARSAPSGAHLFGTDQLGRDVFDRVIHGARHSLAIGVAAMAIAVTAGILLGVLAGLSHRYADEALSRGFDALSSFPLLLLALLFIAIAGPGSVSLVVAIGIATMPHYARVVRAQTFVVRRAGYVTQAVAYGDSKLRLVLRHVLPNVLGPIPVLAMIGLGEAVLAAAGLSFLGMGPQPPSPEWGAMLSEGRGYLRIAWWASVLPGLVVTLTVISLTVTGRHLHHRFEGREAR